MKTTILVAITLITLGSGCDLLGSKETETFVMSGEGGYSGKPVGDCKRGADAECRARGYDEATNYVCRTVRVSGGFFGPFDQDVLYKVTCER